jgi:hypothetical protein
MGVTMGFISAPQWGHKDASDMVHSPSSNAAIVKKRLHHEVSVIMPNASHRPIFVNWGLLTDSGEAHPYACF